MSGHSHAEPGGFKTASARHQRLLLIAFGLTAVYMVAEVIGGLVFNSLALLSDAGHMLTDVAGLGMALAAIQFSRTRRSVSHTYGLYRLEILASLANALLLFAVAGYVLFEAASRFSDPPEVAGVPLLAIAAVGLIVNMISFTLLRSGAKESLNVRGAFLEVLADMLGSVGVIIAGVVLITTGWPYADPIIGAAIGLFILPRTWRLAKVALRILLEVAPPEIDVADAENRLGAIEGVEGVHDLHIWTLTSGLNAATGHLQVGANADLATVLRDATTLLKERFDINHVTLQSEPPSFREEPMEV